jgi:hypothetical protein
LAGVAGTYTNQRERLTTDLAGDLYYAKYKSGGYQNGIEPNPLSSRANLTMSASLLPQRLVWMLADSFGQTAINLVAPDSPSNRQSTNVFSTGPRVTVPFGDRNELLVEGAWFQSTFNSTSGDGQGARGRVALIRKTSNSGSLSIQASASRIVYPSNHASDYSVRSAYFELTSAGARAEANLDLGISQLRVGAFEQSSPLVRATISRRTSARSKLSASIGREYSSAADTFQTNQSFFGIAATSFAEGFVTTGAFRSDYGLVNWNASGQRAYFTIQARLRREAYEAIGAQDFRIYDLYATIGRQIAARVRVSVVAGYDRKVGEFPRIRTSDKRLGVGLTYAFTPRFSMSVGADRYAGDAFGIQRAYVENSQALTFTYRHAPRR